MSIGGHLADVGIVPSHVGQILAMTATVSDPYAAALASRIYKGLAEQPRPEALATVSGASQLWACL